MAVQSSVLTFFPLTEMFMTAQPTRLLKFRRTATQTLTHPHTGFLSRKKPPKNREYLVAALKNLNLSIFLFSSSVFPF